RMAPGDAVQLFDGSGQEYRGQLLEVGKKTVRVSLDQALAGQAESPLHIHLGQGLSRGERMDWAHQKATELGANELNTILRERMDWAIQKATELGANEITPIVSERCEVRLKDERADKRLAHWRQVAISACEQCGRSTLPVIHPPVTLAEWLNSTQADLKLVLH